MGKTVLFKGKQCHLSSPSQIADYKFDWTIENFKFHLKKDCGFMESPLVESEDKKYSWKLRLYFNGQTKESEGYLSIFLYNESPNKGFISEVGISLLNCPSTPKGKFIIKPEENRGYPKFVSKEILAEDPGFISSGHLSILCEIQIFEELSGQSCEGLTNPPKKSLHEDFYKLLKNQALSDATLLVDGSEFKVHKVVLCARSSVFAAMFSHDFEETRTNIIKILDVSPTIMEEVIQFIYTDKFPKLNELVDDVLPIAEKYALLGLKDMCVEILNSQLTIDTAAHILLLADLYNATTLKENIIEFIVMNLRDVSTTPSWIEIRTNNPTLVAEVASKLLSKLEISKKSDT